MCIFCRNDGGASRAREHIIPESLGGPADLTLSSKEVCQTCNSKLSEVDRALIDAFRLLRPAVTETTKRGQPPHARAPGLRFRREQARLDVLIEPTIVGTKGNSALFLPRGEVLVRRAVALRFDERVSRALHKIAFELVCLRLGQDAVLAAEFDNLREYVIRDGGGSRHVLTLAKQSRQSTELSATHGVHVVESLENRNGYLVQLTLCGMQFWIAVAPDPDAILEIGRDMNQRAGECLVVALGADGAARDPAVLLDRGDASACT